MEELGVITGTVSGSPVYVNECHIASTAWVDDGLGNVTRVLTIQRANVVEPVVITMTTSDDVVQFETTGGHVRRWSGVYD